MKKTLLLTAIILLIANVSVAKIRYVKENGMGDGNSWENASGDLQAMIDISSNAGDQIWVAKGTYIAPEGDGFIIKPEVCVYGGFEGNETYLYEVPDTINQKTILKSVGNGRVITQQSEYYSSKLVEWVGFTITGGNATYAVSDASSGGGVFIGSKAQLRYCTITNNIAGENNKSSSGGGVYIHSGYLINCIVSNNIASLNSKGEGGGIAAPAAIVINSLIDDNYASIEGVGYGGGCSGDNSFVNCIITNNIASKNGIGYGGAVYRGRYVNCNLIDNTASLNATGYGGAAYLDDNNPDISLALFNSILWNNYSVPSQDKDIYVEYSTNKSVKNCILKGADSFPEKGNINKDPLFVNLNNKNYQLQAGSPAIDAGDISLYNASSYGSYASYDFTGLDRFVGLIDIGACEKQSTVGVKDNVVVNSNIQFLGKTISNPDQETITIVNSLGVVVLVSDANSIDVQELHSGLYIAKSKTATIKFIK